MRSVCLRRVLVSLWLAAWPGATLLGQAVRANTQRGARRFGEAGCNGCHTVAGVGGMVGPNLTGVAARPLRESHRWASVAAYIGQSIREPQAYVVSGFPRVMPSPTKLQLTEQDIRDLIAYLLTLRAAPDSSGRPP